MILYMQGNGMVFFDVGLTLLALLASVVSFAAYRSKSVEGSDVADHVRAIKAVAWAVCSIFLVVMLIEYGDAPVSGIELVVLWLLAFSDIFAALARIGAQFQREQAELRHRPDTVHQSVRR